MHFWLNLLHSDNCLTKLVSCLVFISGSCHHSDETAIAEAPVLFVTLPGELYGVEFVYSNVWGEYIEECSP